MTTITGHSALSTDRRYNMKLKEIFEKDIGRNINGVIKADQIDDSSKWTELEEYVVTREVSEHLKTFFSRYAEAIDNPNDPDIFGKIGVWITGFFGSGKSHFIKILSYLLENHPITSSTGETKKPEDFFAEKITDELFMGEISSTVSHDTDVILFNIDSKAQQKAEDAILSVFQSVFNEKLGYSKVYPYIAEIERFLDKSGKFETFKKECLAGGLDWDKNKDDCLFYMNVVKKALSTVLGQSEADCEKLIEDYKNSTNLTVEGFANKVKEYLDAHKGKRIIFLVDEIGQFIGQNTKLMLNLQTITENLGTICKGRAWLVVTSQQDVDSIIGDFVGSKANDFSKITGRFNLRLALSSANTDEVIRKRLLKKTPEAMDYLRQLYSEKGDIIKSQTTFTDITKTYKQFKNSDEFADSYPFLPYQYDLIQRVFESIRKAGATGLHLSRGERSMLDSFQQALKSIADYDCDMLVPLYKFYPSIKSFLDTAVIATIDRSETNPSLDQFDVNVLKTLFLIRYVEEMKGTISNLVILNIDKIDTDKVALQKRIQASLDKLERENLINHSGNNYYFLTNEEQNIAREIKRVQLDLTMDIKMLGSTIFDDMFSSRKKHKYKKNGKDFGFSVISDGQFISSTAEEELKVNIITPLNDEYASYNEGRCIMESTNVALLIKCADDPKLLDEIITFLKTENYIKSHNEPSTIPAVKAIYERLSDENRERKQLIKGRVKDMLTGAEYYACGRKCNISGSQPLELLEKGLEILIESAYDKLDLIQNLSSDPIRDIKLLLKSDSTTELGLGVCDVNKQAMDEVRRFIDLYSSRSSQIVLKEVLDKFAARPYGWPDYETALILTRMFIMKEINFMAGGDTLHREQIADYLTAGPKKWTAVTISPRQQVDRASLQKARMICKPLTGDMGPDTDDGFTDYMRKVLNERIRVLENYKSKIEARPSYPGLRFINDMLPVLQDLVSHEDCAEFILRVIFYENDLIDFGDGFEELNDFYTHQLLNWNFIEDQARKFDNNRYFLEKTEAKSDLIRLQEILDSENPYNLIMEAKNIIDRVSVCQNNELKKYREKAQANIDENINIIKEALTKVSASADLSNSSLMPIQNLRKAAEAEEQISRLEYDYARRASDCVNEALDKIKSFSETLPPEKKPEVVIPQQTSIDVKKCMKKPFLKTKEDVQEFINLLKDELNAAIDNNQYVQFK